MGSDDYDADFIEFFWTFYPKKVGKFNAQKEWRKRKLTADRKEFIKQHLIRRVKEDARWLANEKGKTFIVDPERFLKDRREQDVYEHVRSEALHQRVKSTVEDIRPAWQQRGFKDPESYELARDTAAAKALAEIRGLH